MIWQNLIRDWLRRTAEQRVREAMAAAARGEVPLGADFSQPPDAVETPLSAHVGLIAPDHREAVGVIDRLDGLLTIEADRAKVFEGGLNGRRVALVVCGPSQDATAEATQVLIDGHHPDLLVAMGFATGLTSTLQIGDFLLAEQVVSEVGEIQTDVPTVAPVDAAFWHTGRLLSIPRAPQESAERKQLAEKYRAAAADNHAYSVVNVARQQGIPCAALCVVRHASEQQADQDLDLLRRKQSLTRKIGLLTGLALNRPSSLKTVWNEKEQDLMMADRLADGIAKLISVMTRVACLLMAAGIFSVAISGFALAQFPEPPPLLPLPQETTDQRPSDSPPPMPPGEVLPAEPATPAAAAGMIPDAKPLSPSVLAENDFSTAGLRRSNEALLARYGGDPRQIPLAEKAEHLEWVLWRYHRNPYGQIATGAELPSKPGALPCWPADSDTSTWNGVLLSALCWKYAVTKDPQTLSRIVTLLDGMEMYTKITGKPGCYARCVAMANDRVEPSLQKFGTTKTTGPAGEPLVWIGDPARGTYNQLAGGYATLMLYVYDDLPPEAQRKARQLSGDLVMHLLDGDYQIRRPDGQPTTYGDLTPLVATVGIPFNAQVTYLIVALGEQYPPADVEQKGSIEHQFYRLRSKHHAYWANPWKNPIRPQKVGGHPLVKGMNDRFHLVTAAYHGLALEVARAGREKRDLDQTFMYRMGQSLVWTMRRIGGERNALCNFMYAGMLNDPVRFKMIVEPGEQGEAIFQLNRGVVDGLEQLRRYPVDRFRRPGQSEATGEPQWIDQQRPDDFHWKGDPTLRFVASGPARNDTVASIDYLAAYWLMRLHALDRQADAVRQHGAVLP
ncbi:MAG: hypothetical protein K8T91_08115 [Planctomycetes bacterium]|nr:hypothetical protein [Planctomycetota bacterium]